MTLDLSFLLAFFSTLAVIFYLALGGKTKATSGADFALSGRKASSLNVFGAITGTLVGGASTIGTAQLAFMYGLSAWWFTLGAGLACLFLGLFIAVPLRQSQAQTILLTIAHTTQNRYEPPPAFLLPPACLFRRPLPLPRRHPRGSF